MEYRNLGSAGVRVSSLAFGSMTFGGAAGRLGAIGRTDLGEARNLVSRCLDLGVNLFDTADVYSEGRSEEILGAALGRRRSEALIATKLHVRTGPGPNDVGQSRHRVRRACEASLRRLDTDHIDLYQVHGFDALTPLGETLGAMSELVTSGKVSYIGCSNYSAWHLMKALATSRALQLESFVSHQVHYSLLARDYENELQPLAADQGVGGLVWSPLSGGWLSGKYRRNHVQPPDSRVTELGWPAPLDEAHAHSVLDVLTDVAARTGSTVAQIALAWLLSRSTVSSVIVGARNIDQLEENLHAVDVELAADDIARLDKATRRPLPYPYWHQQLRNAERLGAAADSQTE